MYRHVFNTVAAALASMYAAIALGLPMPPIAMATVFIVMQPKARQVLDKSGYRLIGTVAGACATWALGMLFAQTPARFLVAVGVWVSVFTFAAAFSSQLKAYSIVLTGYTPVLIGVPALFQLQYLDVHALARLQEVGVGIACAALAILLNGVRQPRAIGAAHVGAAHGAASTAADTAARTGKSAVTDKPAAAGRVAGRAALVAALHPAMAVLAMGALWLLTSWRGGPMATLNATVDCALVALAAHPLKAASEMSIGTLAAVVIGLALQYAYPMLGGAIPPWTLLAPALAIGAYVTGKPQHLGAGLGYGITLSMLAWPGPYLGGQPIHDAAGLTLSVFVLTAICAILWPFHQRPSQA